MCKCGEMPDPKPVEDAPAKVRSLIEIDKDQAQIGVKMPRLPPQGGYAPLSPDEQAALAVEQVAKVIESGILGPDVSPLMKVGADKFGALVGDALKRPGKDRDMRLIGKFYAVKTKLEKIHRAVEEAEAYLKEIMDQECR